MKRSKFPKLKVCGLTQAGAMSMATALGFDACGLIFYEGSPRVLTLKQALFIIQGAKKELSAFVAPGKEPLALLPLVGVFVNHPYSFIESAIQMLKLSAVQLHGEEPAEMIEQLRKQFPCLAIWKAFRVKDETTLEQAQNSYGDLFFKGTRAVKEGIQNKDENNKKNAAWLYRNKKQVLEHAVLIDFYTKGQHGGTGESLPDALIQPWVDKAKNSILAGGIGPGNVGRFLAFNPYCLDVNSKVEHSPGIKNVAKLKQLIQKYQAYYNDNVK